MTDESRDGAPDAAPGEQARREADSRGQAHPRLTLLRHGEPDWNPAGRVVHDPGLTPFGVVQARAAAKALGRESFDAIYVSPLRRAQETAAPLVEAIQKKPVTVPELAEIEVGLGGRSQEEVDRLFVEAARRPLHEHWQGWPGGETFHAFHARAARGIEAVLARHGIWPERRSEFTVWRATEGTAPHIAIVAHAGTNAVVLTHLLDIRPVPWEWLRFESALAAYSVAQARPLGDETRVWSLQNFNELDHLRAASLL